jgi:hypothetical protein
MSLANYPLSKLLLLCCLTAGLTACGSSDSTDTTETTTDTTSTDDTTETTETIVEVDPFNFESGALVSSITTETCTLSNGDESTCYSIEIVGAPSNYELGNFCPPNITSTADEAGIWFDGNGEVYDITGEFIVNLPTLYSDDNWQLYDEGTGLVNVTDTEESCAGAARPDVDEEYQNHCVECSIDYVDGGISATFLIPVVPVAADSTTSIGNTNVGVALNGVELAAPAPVEDILANYTIAAFDDCAGHINLAVGYHYHGEAGCSQTQVQSDGHAAMMGYALDGYGIFGMLDEDGEEPTDLDSCRGHIDETRGYHYHAADVSENMFIGCFRGVTAR